MSKKTRKATGLRVVGGVTVIVTREDSMFVAYTPALDLSTCGNSFEEANRNLDDAMQAVFEEAIEDGKLEQMLQYYGWEKVVRDNQPHWFPPAVVAHTTHQITIP